MFNFSEKAKKSLPAFFVEFNDVDFYVEDADKEQFYQVILEKIFKDNNIKIDRIFSCKGKTGVIKRYKELKNTSDRINIFILDRDFDDLLGKIINDKCVYYLPEYCIENLLIEKSAFFELAKEEEPRLLIDEFDKKFSFDRKMNENVNKLFDLFVCYYLVHNKDRSMKNVGHSPGKFFVNDNCMFCEKKIKRYIIKVANRYYSGDKNKLYSEIKKTKKNILKKERNKKKYISGKYLLFQLRIYFRKKIRFSGKNESFNYRLAKNCKFENMMDLRNRVLELYHK